jgi:hypothetical protein
MIRASERRAFVMPVVILLVIMVGAVASIMLQRHVARAKTIQRQIQAYQEHHGVRSLQAVVEAWRKSPTAQPRDIAEMLEPDGLAFTVDPGDNTSIQVYLFPGQETMLRRVGGLPESDRAAAEQALIYLRESENKDPLRLESLLRDAGPLAVDVNRADPAVLGAIVRGVLGDDTAARSYERALLNARLGDQAIGLQSLTNIATESGISAEQRTAIGRFFTVSPEVWRFRLDVRGAGVASTAGLVSRYEGLLLLGGTSNPANTNTFEEPTPFLTWRRINLDDPRAVE